jgi:hypothetical protein
LIRFIVQGFAGGGLSPVFATSFSTVTVVVPPGVVTFVSSVVDAFSAQPNTLTDNRPSITTELKIRFMFRPFI